MLQRLSYLISIPLLGVVLIVLSGCSSTPAFVPVEASMDCVYSSDTQSNNGDIDHSKRSKCSTNPLELYANTPPSIQCMYSEQEFFNSVTGAKTNVRQKRCRDQITGNWYTVSTH
jgi:hypothetical protein